MPECQCAGGELTAVPVLCFLELFRGKGILQGGRWKREGEKYRGKDWTGER